MATMLGLTPQQKAALVVVSGLPAPPGVAGVIVQKYDRDAARPVGALVVADQEGGRGACAKHFPGLGSLAFSTDDRPYVLGRVREADLAPYRAAVEAGVPCVMVGHGVYPTLGPRRAALEPAAYRLLRDLGFEGVAITDSLDVVRGHAQEWAVAAARAGADLLLFTSGADAARAIRVLLPLARSGELDAHVARVLRFRLAID